MCVFSLLALAGRFPTAALDAPRSRRYELGRVAGNTKLSQNVTVRRIRVRGGSFKFRALRLDSGNFAWPSQSVTRKTRLLEVGYNASNNELVWFAALAGSRGCILAGANPDALKTL